MAAAGFGAVKTEIVVATPTVREVLLGDAPAAVVALPTLPGRQGPVGTAGVIGFQDLPHDDTEVKEASLLRGLADPHLSLPLAEGVSLDVRMIGVIRISRRVGIEGHDIVGGGTSKPLQADDDAKATEVDAFQHDPPGRHSYGSLPEVDLEVIEFRLECRQVVDDVAEADYGARPGS